jgi:hypothetical protein
LAKFQSPRTITRPKIIGPERNVNLICNLLLYTHIPYISQYLQAFCSGPMIFGRVMAVWECKLQINFEIRSGWRIFGQLTAVGLWNLAKYLVVTTLFHYDLRYCLIIHSHTKNEVNISNHSEIKWWQLNIRPKAITRPKIVGPERNVNLICNSSLYTYIAKIKSISPSIAKKSDDLRYWLHFWYESV